MADITVDEKIHMKPTAQGSAMLRAALAAQQDVPMLFTPEQTTGVTPDTFNITNRLIEIQRMIDDLQAALDDVIISIE